MVASILAGAGSGLSTRAAPRLAFRDIGNALSRFRLFPVSGRPELPKIQPSYRATVRTSSESSRVDALSSHPSLSASRNHDAIA